MTQDEIIEMAREATNNEPIYCRQEFTFSAKQLQAFAKLVAAKEREACAKVCDSFQARDVGMQPAECAGAIRARGEQTLAQPEQEPVAWPCLIAEADFSENTVILAMQCTDYKVSAGNHWLSNTPPQRTWVGLTKTEVVDLLCEYSKLTGNVGWQQLIYMTEAKLKQKNGYAEENT